MNEAPQSPPRVGAPPPGTAPPPDPRLLGNVVSTSPPCIYVRALGDPRKLPFPEGSQGRTLPKGFAAKRLPLGPRASSLSRREAGREGKTVPRVNFRDRPNRPPPRAPLWKLRRAPLREISMFREKQGTQETQS